MTLLRALGGPILLLLLALSPGGPAAAQSLFQGGGGSPLLQPARGPLAGQGGRLFEAAAPMPFVQPRALALGDRDGLAARRQRWFDPLPGRGYRPPPAREIRAEAAWLAAHPPQDFSRESALMCLAVSIYHEARNQPRQGQAAVASVILTRAADPLRWGRTPCTVVVPVQFSYLTPARRFAPIRNRRAWIEAVEIAAQVLMAGPDPRLRGADHYHATYVDPVWNKDMDLVQRIADHIFWRSRPGRS